MFTSVLTFLFSNKYELKGKRTFCLASFVALIGSQPPVITLYFSHQRRRIVPDVDAAPGDRQEPSKWHFNRLSSLGVWIRVTLTPVRAAPATGLSSPVGLIASVSPGCCLISVFFLLNLPAASVSLPTGPAIQLICYSTCFYSTQLWSSAH